MKPIHHLSMALCLIGVLLSAKANAQQCTPPEAECADGKCHNLETDIAHCGECENSCLEVTENVVTASCVVGVCEYDVCVGDYMDCDEDRSNGCEELPGSHEFCSDCDDECARLEECVADGASFICTSTCEDADGDGFADATCAGIDCNDADIDIFPGAQEICDEIDNDCDGVTDEGFDTDGDGYKTCGAEVDCDDDDDSINPGAEELCGNDIDEDCDGQTAPACTNCEDADKDGFMDAACGGADCNDLDPKINPDADEKCDSVDNNCDGEVDEGDTCELGDEGCDCSSSTPNPLSSGVCIFMMMAIGLAWLNRRNF